MNTPLSKQDLIDFENDIAECFKRKEIEGPIHLSSGNEDYLIKIFENVSKDDWVCCSWRSHIHCLLKGVPKELLKNEIIKGHSISLCFPEYKIISSGIVGGILPIALGISKAIKLRGEAHKVFAFVGDHTAETGTFHECYKYSRNFDLPITWVIENNGLSVCTPITHSWNIKYPTVLKGHINENIHWYSRHDLKLIYYRYTNGYPHSGGFTRTGF